MVLDFLTRLTLSGGNTEDISHQLVFTVKENLDDRRHGQGNQYLIECS